MIDRKQVERWKALAAREPDFYHRGCDARIRQLSDAVLELMDKTGPADDDQKKTIYVYVAGPLTGSGLEHENVRNAINVAHHVARMSIDERVQFVPFVPHLMAAQWGLMYREPEEFWLSMCFAWVARCDAMIVIAGVSPGTRKEVILARELGIPVFGLGEGGEGFSALEKEFLRPRVQRRGGPS